MPGGAVVIVLTLCGISELGWMIGIFVLIVLVPFLYSVWLHAAKGL